MRTILLGSLLDVVARNIARGANSLALFESARVYLREGAPVFAGDKAAPFAEPHRFAGIAVGPLVPRSWRGGGEPADFFAVKGVLEALATQLGVGLELTPAEQPFLHPGRSAAISVEGAEVGWLGEVHPLVCRTWDIDAAVAFELDAAPLIGAASLGEESYEDVTTFPAVYQDLAVVVPAATPAGEVRAAVLAGGGDLLHAAEVFDLYEGEQVGADRKSLALNLEFRADDRTLTDDEVAGLREAIKAKLGELGGSLRE
jgi:phenylalanyl-tRNA synthetase beta chain